MVCHFAPEIGGTREVAESLRVLAETSKSHLASAGKRELQLRVTIYLGDAVISTSRLATVADEGENPSRPPTDKLANSAGTVVTWWFLGLC